MARKQKPLNELHIISSRGRDIAIGPMLVTRYTAPPIRTALGSPLNVGVQKMLQFVISLTRAGSILILLAAAIVTAGLLGIARAIELQLASEELLFRQGAWVGVAVLAMVGTAMVNYRVYCRWSYLLLAVAIGLLVVVFFTEPIHAARRWVRLGPVGFQPSEFAKLAFVLALARWLMYRDNVRRLRGLLPPFLLVIAPVLLILKEPDLGTAIVFLPVLFAMLFVAGASKRHLAVVLTLALATVPMLWAQMSREQKSRVTALLEQNRPKETPTSDGYHLHHAKQAIALGGFQGSRTAIDQESTNAEPVAYFVPEAATDSIFSILGERYGIFGVAILFILYALLIGWALKIAAATREPFGRLVATGLAVLIAVQVLVNTAMMVGLLPITGLSLPMISYGGSGLLGHGVALGLLININLRRGYEISDEPFRFTSEV